MNGIDVLKFGVGILIGVILIALASRTTGVDFQLLISAVVLALLVAGAVLYTLGKIPVAES